MPDSVMRSNGGLSHMRVVSGYIIGIYGPKMENVMIQSNVGGFKLLGF